MGEEGERRRKKEKGGGGRRGREDEGKEGKRMGRGTGRHNES